LDDKPEEYILKAGSPQLLRSRL